MTQHQTLSEHYKYGSAPYIAASHWLRSNAKHKRLKKGKKYAYHKDDIAAFKAQYGENGVSTVQLKGQLDVPSGYESISEHYKTVDKGYKSSRRWLQRHAKHPVVIRRDKYRFYHKDDIAAFKAQYAPQDNHPRELASFMRRLQCVSFPAQPHEIMGDLDAQGYFYEMATLSSYLSKAEKRGLLERTGRGVKGSPYTYHLPAEDKAA